MNALDPAVYARPAYLPTGPRGDYRPDQHPYRRDEGSLNSRPAAPAHGPAPRDTATIQEEIAVNSPNPSAPAPAQPVTREPLENRSYHQGRPAERIRSALGDGIEDVGLLIHAVHEEGAVVRSLLTRMRKAGDLEILEAGSLGQLRRVRLKAKDAQITSTTVATKPAASQPTPVNRPEGIGCGSQVQRVGDALQRGKSISLPSLAEQTRLTRDQVIKAVSYLIRRGGWPIDRWADTNGESWYELRGEYPSERVPSNHGLHPAEPRQAGQDSAEPLNQPVAKTNDGTEGNTLMPPTAPERDDPVPTPDDIIDQLQDAAMGALEVLRDAFSQLADLARENAAASDRLAAVRKMLGGED